MTYESFSAYYGGTDVPTLRRYAAQSQAEHDPERAAMFTRLAAEKERGVIFVPDDRNSKLSYRRIR